MSNNKNKIIEILGNEITSITKDACKILKEGVQAGEAWAVKMYFSQIFPKVFKNEDLELVDLSGIDLTVKCNDDVDRICHEISQRIAKSSDSRLTIQNSLEIVKTLRSLHKDIQQTSTEDDLSEDQLRDIQIILKAGSNYRSLDGFN